MTEYSIKMGLSLWEMLICRHPQYVSANGNRKEPVQMPRLPGVTPIAAGIAHALTWCAGLWMTIGPAYEGVSVTATTPGESASETTRVTATLVEVNGLWVLWLLLVPSCWRVWHCWLSGLQTLGRQGAQHSCGRPRYLFWDSAQWQFSRSAYSTCQQRWLYCLQLSPDT